MSKADMFDVSDSSSNVKNQENVIDYLELDAAFLSTFPRSNFAYFLFLKNKNHVT